MTALRQPEAPLAWIPPDDCLAATGGSPAMACCLAQPFHVNF